MKMGKNKVIFILTCILIGMYYAYIGALFGKKIYMISIVFFLLPFSLLLNQLISKILIIIAIVSVKYLFHDGDNLVAE